MTREEMRFRRLAVAEAARKGGHPLELAKKFHLSRVAIYKICAREGVKLQDRRAAQVAGGGE